MAWLQPHFPQPHQPTALTSPLVSFLSRFLHAAPGADHEFCTGSSLLNYSNEHFNIMPRSREWNPNWIFCRSKIIWYTCFISFIVIKQYPFSHLCLISYDANLPNNGLFCLCIYPLLISCLALAWSRCPIIFASEKYVMLEGGEGKGKEKGRKRGTWTEIEFNACMNFST